MTGLVLQCGGPTAVVNASLAAVIRRWRELGAGGALLGGRYGLRALVTNDWVPLDVHDETWLRELDTRPGMALGGGRDRLDSSQQGSAIETLRARGVDVLILLGGNGTMAAARELAMRTTAPRIITVPKTIDNDIPQTEIAPGYLSAARFLRDAVRDISDDVLGMIGYEQVVLIETMGRHAGWLAVAALLARRSADDAPHVVLTPEREVDEDAFLTDVERCTRDAGVCVAVVSEGVRDAAGRLLTLKNPDRRVEYDPSGQVILGRSGGPLPYLAGRIRERLGLRCRQVRPDVLQRCSRVHATALDRRLAALAGVHAVDVARQGAGGVMATLRRDASGWHAGSVPLGQVAGERVVPPGFEVESLRELIDAE